MLTLIALATERRAMFLGVVPSRVAQLH